MSSIGTKIHSVYAVNIDFNRSRASSGHVSKQLFSVASDLNTGALGFG